MSRDDNRAVGRSPLLDVHYEEGKDLPNKYGDRDMYQEVADKYGWTREEAKARVLADAYGLTKTPLTQVAAFHRKFGLPGVDQEAPRELTDEEALFRINFMLEEIAEYAGCAGFRGVESYLKDFCHDIKEQTEGRLDLADLRREDERDLHGQLDALVDLSYVTHGTALFHGFKKFDKAFDTVHEANMGKVRAERAEQSKRGSTFDVVKPPGWSAPVLTEYLK